MEHLEFFEANPTVLAHIRVGGISSLDALTGLSDAAFERVLGVSKTKRAALRKELARVYPRRALRDLPAPEQASVLLSTGVPGLDALAYGGFRAGETVEIFGEFRTGKTQLGHYLATVAVTDQLTRGVLPARPVLYVDTEGTFRPERVADFAAGRGVTGHRVLPHLLHVPARSFTELELVTRDLPGVCATRHPCLVVVDSLTHLYRAEVQQLPDTRVSTRQRFLAILERLQTLARAEALVLVATNQVTFAPTPAYPPHKPVADVVTQLFFKERIFLGAEPGAQSGMESSSASDAAGETQESHVSPCRTLALVNSAWRPPGTIRFSILARGIQTSSLRE